MRRVLKSVFFALLIISVQVIIYKIYFGDAPPEIPRARLYKDFPAIKEGIDNKLKVQIERLNSPSENERISGALEIKKFGKKAKDAVEYLVRVSKDESMEVRTSVLSALKEIDDPGAVSAFVFALDDESAKNRKEAADYLGKLRDESAVKPLIETLNDDEWDVRFAASLSLKNITGEDFGADYEKWSNWYENNR